METSRSYDCPIGADRSNIYADRSNIYAWLSNELWRDGQTKIYFITQYKPIQNIVIDVLEILIKKICPINILLLLFCLIPEYLR